MDFLWILVWFASGFLMFSYSFHRFCYDFIVILVLKSQGTPYGFLVDCVWFSYGFLMFPVVFICFPMIFL